MVERSSFFNSVNRDRLYNAEDFARYFASFIGTGVYPNPSDNLQVVENNSMGVTVNAGKAFIKGYFYYNEEPLTVALSTADGVQKRIDRIVLRWNLQARSINVAVLEGALSARPTAAALTRNNDVYEIALADILVNNGAIKVLNANISDLRLNTSLCGLVTHVISNIDTGAFYTQMNAQLSSFIDLKTGEFSAWFTNLQDMLNENAEANLVTRIGAVETAANANTLAISNFAKSRYVDANGAESATGAYTQIKNGDTWEWLNPPLDFDMEYRTTKRFKGSVVYQRIVSLGLLPSSTSKSITLPYTPIYHQAWFQASPSNTTSLDVLPSTRPYYSVDLYRAGKTVTITTANTSLSSYYAYMLIEYIK